MARIQIVNKARGKNENTGRLFADAVSKEIEAIARREAAKNGFNIDKEQNGLMRAMLHVLTRHELLQEATRLAREKLEQNGLIAKEDEKIVKRKK